MPRPQRHCVISPTRSPSHFIVTEILDEIIENYETYYLVKYLGGTTGYVIKDLLKCDQLLKEYIERKK